MEPHISVSSHATTQLQQLPPDQQTNGPKVESHVLAKSDGEAHAAQKTIVDGLKTSLGDRQITANNLLSRDGLRTVLGKSTTRANVKDGVVHLMHKISSKLMPDSVGSHVKEAKRLADRYQTTVSQGGTSQEKISVLKQLKDQLAAHGDKGNHTSEVIKFVDKQITIHENEETREPMDAEAKNAHDAHEFDVALKEGMAKQLNTRSELQDEIQSFDRSDLNKVDQPKEQGVPQWARHEFNYSSLRDQTYGANPRGPRAIRPQNDLGEPTLATLRTTTKNSLTFKNAGVALEKALVSKNTESQQKLSDALASKIAVDIKAAGHEAELSFVTSDGESWKDELLTELHKQAPNATELGQTYATSSPEMKAFLDKLYNKVAASLSDRQTAPDEVTIGGKTYTKAENLGAGGFGSVDRYVAPDGTAIAIKTLLNTGDKPEEMAKRFQDAADEARAHRSASGQNGHPNVVDFKSAIRTENGDLMIAMELAPHGDAYGAIDKLAAALDKGLVSLEAANLVRVMMLQDMVEGMQHMQESRGMTHLDLKDPNIFIGADGRCKIGDFGTAEIGVTRRITKDSGMPDNRLWLAPELIIGNNNAGDARDAIRNWAKGERESADKALEGLSPGEIKAGKQKNREEMDRKIEEYSKRVGFNVSNKIDTWSLGVTAHRMFLGTFPFDDRFMSVVENMLTDFANDPTNLLRAQGQDDQGAKTGTGVTSLDRLLNAMMNPNPALRPSMTDLMESSLFKQPGLGQSELRQLLIEITKDNPDPAKLKQLNETIGV
jgi:serine/threonine protein kinase